MKKYFYCMLLLAWGGCVPSMKMVNKNYSSNSVRERTVTLFPITDTQITITYGNPIKNIFQPDPRDLKTIVRDSCFPMMEQELIKHLKAAKYNKLDSQFISLDTPNVSENYFPVIYPIGKERQKTTFLVPKKDKVNPAVDCAIIISFCPKTYLF